MSRGPTMRVSLGQLLKEMGLVSEEDIQAALKVQKQKGGALGKILVEEGFVSDKDMMFALGAQMGMAPAELSEIEVPEDVIARVPQNIAESYQVVPIMFEDDVLTVALSDPMNPTVLDDLTMLLKCRVEGAVSSPDEVAAALEKYYGAGDVEMDSMESILAEAGMAEGDLMVIDDKGGKMDLERVQELANSTPVVKLLNLVLLQAIKAKAADVHLEPFEKEFKIRYRVDGVLYEMMPPPAHLASAITSRVKVMAGLDIAETRLPQDGRIELTIGKKPVDLRVSTLPTMFGESVVMRILDRSNINLDLERIGLRPRELKAVRALIQKPNGIVLVTGPTGSGKTTTLYSCLTEINSPEDKIITTEDPVEYELDGIIQVQVNDEIGVTYASCLRAILRQDPDTVLVGEIRDLETAQIAVEASLTGHLVLSTLHTNDAPSAITRLVDLGIEPFLVAAVLEAVIAQRLVRKICTNCKTEYQPTVEELYELELTPEDVEDRTFYYGKGCKLCNNTGYSGRIALFEIMLSSETMRQEILKDVAASKLRECAKENGMYTLRESGLLLIFDGVTSIEEIVKETITT